ncbi:MAG: acetamidase/formamidase family protein [Cyanobacteria bacterium]|nr:acetamidase/formamidase family protein [Cyanobacteriota bacterium]MDW8200996.1 acetamidase/formamidase family protein [Cyanobacteriota bacterium SKYGB_h_bin112]
MANHSLKATLDTVHVGGFSPDLLPVLTVQSGDRIHVETYTGFYLAQDAPPEFVTPELLAICRHLPSEKIVGPGPHLLTGPIWVDQAEPGDVLEIRLESITPRLSMGFNAIRRGWGALPNTFTEPALRFIPLDLHRGVAEFPPGKDIYIPLRPFFGILAVAPTTVHSSVPPGNFGGNLDNRQLQAGARLFLPVQVPGALFSIGDGHAAQGDGEVDVTAIEVSMNGSIQLILHKDLSVQSPIAETPTDWIVMGYGTTLDTAFEDALQKMIDWLSQRVPLSPEEAYVLCSLAVNFHVTQVVNSPQKGIHALLPKSILPSHLVML